MNFEQVENKNTTLPSNFDLFFLGNLWGRVGSRPEMCQLLWVG